MWFQEKLEDMKRFEAERFEELGAVQNKFLDVKSRLQRYVNWANKGYLQMMNKWTARKPENQI